MQDDDDSCSNGNDEVDDDGFAKRWSGHGYDCGSVPTHYKKKKVGRPAGTRGRLSASARRREMHNRKKAALREKKVERDDDSDTQDSERACDATTDSMGDVGTLELADEVEGNRKVAVAANDSREDDEEYQRMLNKDLEQGGLC